MRKRRTLRCNGGSCCEKQIRIAGTAEGVESVSTNSEKQVTTAVTVANLVVEPVTEVATFAN